MKLMQRILYTYVGV